MRTLAVLLLVVAGCSKSSGVNPEALKKDVAACETSHKTAIADPASASQETREMHLTFAIGDCAGACGLGDKASCAPMEADIHALCATKPDWCVTVCHSNNDWEKKAACDAAGLPMPK